MLSLNAGHNYLKTLMNSFLKGTKADKGERGPAVRLIEAPGISDPQSGKRTKRSSGD
jgi:hypothetical protein